MISFRGFCESSAYCGLTLSPLMAAIDDASEGIAPALDDETSVRHFGCAASSLPREPRRTVVVRAGGRGGKTSRLLAPKALHAAWTVPLPTLRTGEVASSLLVAPDMKLARQALSFVEGYVRDSKVLRRALVGEPTKDALELKRPDGKVVRIEVLAASRGGRAVRGRTLVFAGLDEAAFFYDEQTGVVNDAELYRAVLQRIVPGGQCWIVSTPWLADVGLLEERIAKNFGSHGHALAAIAGTRALNPTWDPTGEIERDLREQDPAAATREIDAMPMAGGSMSFFDANAVNRAIDESLTLPLAPAPGIIVTCGGDFGFRSDSSTLVVAHRSGKNVCVADLLELRPTPGAPLQPSEAVRELAARAKQHGASRIMADGHYRESIAEHLRAHGLALVDAPAGAIGKSESYVLARTLLHEGRLRLPKHDRLLRQMREVVSKPLPGGGVSISSPRWKGGGHGDLVSALVLALYPHGGHEVRTAPEPETATQRAAREQRAIFKDVRKKFGREPGQPWWKQ